MLADLIGQPQFKIPLHGFTDQRRLVAHLLAVANRRIAAAEVGMFAYRRAAAKISTGILLFARLMTPQAALASPTLV